MINKYNVGESYELKRDVGIYLDNYDQVVDYPRGELFDILSVREESGIIKYRIEFWMDEDQKYEFDEIAIDSFLEDDEE